jgi:DnaJ family protein C protein 11
LPHVLVAQNISLGATVTPNMRSLIGTKGIWSRQPFSFLRDSTVHVEAGVFPIPSLKTTVGHAFQPVPGMKPINISASSTITRSLRDSLPSIDVQATKQIAQRKVAFLTWSSGLIEWPERLQETFPSLGMSLGSYYNTGASDSTFQIGLISQPKQPSRMVELDEDNDDDDDGDELREQLEKQQEIDRTAEFWQTYLTATPAGGGIGLTYSRNLFSGKPADDPVRSEWSGEGYFPMAKMEEPRAVRLEITTIVSADASISWGIKGTRRVGEYTRMSLGVGLAQNGIIATVSWNRLGQGIKLPIVICPADQANHDAAALAAAFPMLAYCAVEFGYIRPRDRRRRRQAAARRHKDLKKLIPKKREESEQAIELMFDQVQRRQAREEAQNGLIIKKAEYGYIPPTNKKPKNGFTEPRIIDVTIPVAALVDRGQLVIPQNSIKVRSILSTCVVQTTI